MSNLLSYNKNYPDLPAPVRFQELIIPVYLYLNLVIQFTCNAYNAMHAYIFIFKIYKIFIEP